MSAATFGQKRFIPVPPDKGSFPLDHENLCKQHMTAYMNCLKNNLDDNSLCRTLAKNYLQCRMDNDLMAKEEWKMLGYRNTNESEDKKQEKQ